MPDMPNDCRHDKYATDEVGGGLRLTEANPHPGNSGVSSVLIGASSVAVTICPLTTMKTLQNPLDLR
jgi:hypothetical protein